MTKLFYVCVRKSDHKMVICTGKSSVTAFTKVSSDTLRRHNDDNVYETKEFIIYIGIELLNRNNKKCCDNYTIMKQRKVTDNISKYNHLPQQISDVTAKHIINKDGIDYDISKPVPGLF